MRLVHSIAPLPVVFVSIIYKSWLAIIIYAAVSILAVVATLKLAPLHPISEREAKERRFGRKKQFAILGLGIAMLLGLGYFLDD